VPVRQVPGLLVSGRLVLGQLVLVPVQALAPLLL
jgi:hypothetical protein